MGGMSLQAARRPLLVAAITVLCAPAFAQAPQGPDVAAQKAAMAKLGFLVGKWSGPISVQRGPGEPLKMTQTEDVSMKLDGLVLLIEGASRDSAGQVRFRAMATVSYDDAEKKYHFRAYNDGRFLDTDLAAPPAGVEQGFAWSFGAGPVHITNTMHVTPAGEWAEQTESAYNGQPPRSTMQMTLQKQP